MNPSFTAGHDTASPSDEAQSIFLDTNLIESVTTITENIGAEYGGFTGGVVDAKLKDAHTDRWHIMTNFRYTKDSWAKFHLTDEQKNINQSTGEDFQPEFNKYEYTISADGPINENLGLLFSYGKQHSKIPLWSYYDVYNPDNTTYKDRRIQYRNNENYLIKLNTYDVDDLEASLTMIYAPHVYTYHNTYARNSDYDIIGGGLNIAYDMKNELNFGILKNTLAYKQDKITADDNQNLYYTWAFDPNNRYATWTMNDFNSLDGGRGDREFSGQSLIYKSVLELDEIETGSFTHLIKTGLEAEFGKAKYEREEGLSFGDGELNSSVTGSKDSGIIEGEQWTKRLDIVEAIDNKKSYTTAALFFEDSIKVDRYTIRSGLRISTDTVTNNKDIAPRLFANADIFGDEVWNVYGGYNRYYGGLILYDAIYELEMTRYARTAPDAGWTPQGYFVKYNFSLDGIKTPYSDEFSLGSSLSKWDTLFKLDFVKREYKDQIKQKTVSSVYTTGWTDSYINTNDGRSSYWGVTLTASKEYELKNTKHFSEFSITKSEASNNLNGMNGFSDEDDYSQTYITYDGELKKYEDVPSPDYNAPLVITYSHIMELSDYLRFGLNARYEKGVDGYKWVDDWGGLTDPDGKDTRVYESKHYRDSFTVDLSTNYDLKIRGNKLTFGIEVLNLLNRKNDADYSSSNSFVENYAMGRQFYANFRYEY